MRANKQILVLLALALLLLPGCGEKEAESPEPAKLYAAICEHADLPEDMADMTGELLEDATGISPEMYESAVYCLVETGLTPDEIAIVKADDEESAGEIQNLLEKRLAYKRKAAENYLTEFMPVLKAGTVRRDGLTVSLLVTEDMEGVLSAFGGISG